MVTSGMGRLLTLLTGKIATSRLAAKRDSSRIPLNFKALRTGAESNVRRRV
jgi:hypothetical protein